MTKWTVDLAVENNTDFKLYPLAPQSQATWFGSVENTPAVIGAHSSGHAGRFAAPSGEAVGTTGISVYTGLDPTKVWILLIMMPYGTDTKNVAKVVLYEKHNTKMEVDTVKHVWYNTLVGNSLEWSWTEGGEQKTVFVTADIDQGFNVTASFKVEMK